MSVQRVLSFVLNGEFFALPMSLIDEVQPYHIMQTQLPHSSTHLLGHVEYNGESLSVLDLKREMNLTCAKSQSYNCLILIHNQENQLAIAADEVYSVLELDFATQPQAHKPWLKGAGHFGEKSIYLIDAQKIFDLFDSFCDSSAS